ncbi:MAG TPA: Holliday junction branch migration protein RuvA [Candidatus Baltobacteraceae bacterium]|jgi:Holliday junction DNA helicase RuvA|nr:Holliday junction branch migration protein RuvA [Candidatus Baltobacteraceae bacterium]
MFSRIQGRIVQRSEDSVVIDVGGIGYEVILPPCVAEKLRSHADDTPVTLEIYASLSIDGNSGRFAYFGFTNAVERDFFEALISVASIGPKTAARAFSFPMARIARAIDSDDQAFLVKLPGIGKQKARDIVAKLQGKVTRFLLIQEPDGHYPRPEPRTTFPDFAAEALAVLVQLEYRRSEAEAMIKRTLALVPHVVDAETLLSEVYKHRADLELVR